MAVPAEPDAVGEGHRRHAVVGALGGLMGAFAVIMGLLFVNKIGAGPFAGLTITANILMSLVIDQFGLFGIEQHSLNIWRILGGALMTGGIVLIALF
jgi:transporter family-2 protein